MPASRPTAARRTLVLCVLGGIGSGKSAAARLLAGDGGLVLDADRMAREELEQPGNAAWLRERFGDAVIDVAGHPDRTVLAERVFARPEELRALEERLHPAVRARLQGELEDARRRGVPRVVLDVPLLLENEARHGLRALCDTLVYVDAPLEQRERRVAASRGWSASELARREAAQLPLAEKRARADHVLDNGGDLADLAAAARRLLAHLARTP